MGWTKGVDRYRVTARESDIEATLIDGVANSGGYAFHVRDSRKQNVTGLTDLILILPPIVALIEVKSQYRKVEDHQRHVLDLLAECDTVVSGIVRPRPKDGELSIDEALALIGVKTQEAGW